MKPFGGGENGRGERELGRVGFQLKGQGPMHGSKQIAFFLFFTWLLVTGC